MDHLRGGESPPNTASKACRSLLAKQLGLITREQALRAGLTARQIEGRVRREEWALIYRGVYADRAGAHSWRRSVFAAVLRGGPEAVASGACAAALLSLPGFRPGEVEITTPKRLKEVPFTARLGRVPPAQLARVGPIPVTNADRTLLDIAGRGDQLLLEDALDDVLRRQLTSLPRLRWFLHTLTGKGKKGSGTLRRLVDERSDGEPIPESVLETRLWKPLSRLGVSRPIRQHPVAEGRYRIDFAFPHAMVAVEAQRYRWHSSRRAWERDIDKANALTGLGWMVVYVTWSDLKDDIESTVARLRDLLLPRFL